MRLILYIFFFSQIFNFLRVIAERVNEDQPELNKIKWEKVSEKKSIPLKKIIWKSYNNDEIFFEKVNLNEASKTRIDSSIKEGIYKPLKKSTSLITEIEPFLPLNNFLDYGNFQTSVRWKSSFDGGVSGGTGQQNPSFVLDYGISDSSLFSFYVTGADDELYKLVEGQKVNYYWQSYAFSFKRKLIDEDNFDFGLSMASTLEYWRHASGSETSKSIYNQLDDSYGKDKFESLVGALSFPLSKNFNEKFNFFVIPGITFLPEHLGSKGVGKNAYGNNFYIGSGFVFDISENLNSIVSYTVPLGPGNNYFDSNLKYDRKSIYSFGLGWDINPQIGIEGKITNAYGGSPSTGLLTIPSDNLPLYSANIIYRHNEEDTYLNPLSERDKLISHGGISVSNALMPKAETSQINFNYDSEGNLFGFYGYSLSNIFQLELLNIGSFNDLNFSGSKSSNLYSMYLGENNLNFRLGGKILIFSPQKNDLYWLSIRTSVGRNNETNQGYLFSEFINTFRVNSWLTLNVSPKYFFSGVESFGGMGFSSYINFSDDLLLISELNTSIKNDSDLNSTIALRYSFSPEKSLDLYYSNAAGIQDIGQLLKDEEFRLGIKLNFLY